MSAGFRIFLLILVSFAAISAYRFRSPELYHWLRAGQATAPEAEDSLISPVERVLERDVSLARLMLESPRRVVPVHKEEPPQELELAEAQLTLSPEEAAEVADLPTFHDEAEEPAAAPSEVVEGSQLAPEPTPGEPQPPSQVKYQEIEYEVKSGDSLWKIAQKTLGSGSRLEEIKQANPEHFQGTSGDVIKAGVVLRLRVPILEEGLKVPTGDADRPSWGSPTRSRKRPGQAPLANR